MKTCSVAVTFTQTMRRWVALLTCAVFIQTTLLPPAQASTSNPIADVSVTLPSDFASIQLPPEIGKIDDIFNGQTGGAQVIVVQDAHAIPDAQRSIRKAILYFYQRYGVNLVALEGASAKLDARMLKSFPDKERLNKVLSEYFDQGELAGGTAAAISGIKAEDNSASGTRMIFQGVEDWPVYEQALMLYRVAMQKETEVLGALTPLKTQLQEDKNTHYTEALQKVDQALLDFRENQNDFLKTLEELAAVKAPEAGSELALLLEQGKKEKQGGGGKDFTAEVRALSLKVEGYFKTAVSSEAAKALQSELQGKKQQFQTSQITPEAFALALKDIAAKAGLQIQVSDQLLGLVQKEKRMTDIEGTKLFADFELYAQSVKETLFKNDTDREIDRRDRRLWLATKLAKLEVSYEDWVELEQMRRDGTWSVDGKKMTSMDTLFEPHFAFYENAQKRDEVFFKNLSTQLKDVKAAGRSAVMVAGGFHAHGLCSLLKENGISYALVMPEIKNLPAESHYRAQMRGKFSWSSYFEVKDGKVNVYNAFIRSTRDRLIGESRESSVVSLEQKQNPRPTPQDPRLLKNWRDQIIRDLADEGRITKAGEYTRFIDELTGAQRDKAIQKRLAQVDKFLEDLKVLDAQGQFTAPNIAKLFQPATASPFVVVTLQNGGLVPANLVGAKSEVRLATITRDISINVQDLAHVTTEQGEKVTLTLKNVQEAFLAQRPKVEEIRGDERIIPFQSEGLNWQIVFEDQPTTKSTTVTIVLGRGSMWTSPKIKIFSSEDRPGTVDSNRINALRGFIADLQSNTPSAAAAAPAKSVVRGSDASLSSAPSIAAKSPAPDKSVTAVVRTSTEGQARFASELQIGAGINSESAAIIYAGLARLQTLAAGRDLKQLLLRAVRNNWDLLRYDSEDYWRQTLSDVVEEKSEDRLLAILVQEFNFSRQRTGKKGALRWKVDNKYDVINAAERAVDLFLNPATEQTTAERDHLKRIINVSFETIQENPGVKRFVERMGNTQRARNMAVLLSRLDFLSSRELMQNFLDFVTNDIKKIQDQANNYNDAILNVRASGVGGKDLILRLLAVELGFGSAFRGKIPTSALEESRSFLVEAWSEYFESRWPTDKTGAFGEDYTGFENNPPLDPQLREAWKKAVLENRLTISRDLKTSQNAAKLGDADGYKESKGKSILVFRYFNGNPDRLKETAHLSRGAYEAQQAGVSFDTNNYRRRIDEKTGEDAQHLRGDYERATDVNEPDTPFMFTKIHTGVFFDLKYIAIYEIPVEYLLQYPPVNAEPGGSKNGRDEWAFFRELPKEYTRDVVEREQETQAINRVLEEIEKRAKAGESAVPAAATPVVIAPTAAAPSTAVPAETAAPTAENYFDSQRFGEILQAPSFSADDAVRELGKIPFSSKGLSSISSIGDLFKRQGVGDHTKTVLNQFERYYDGRSLPAGVSRSFARLMFLVHDLGKAVDQWHQHDAMPAILNAVRAVLPVSEEEFQLLSAIVIGDPIGSFLKRPDLGFNNLSKDIAGKADSLQMDRAEFFKLLTLFYQIDVSAYTRAAGQDRDLDHLFQMDRGTEGSLQIGWDNSKDRLQFSSETESDFETFEAAVLSVPTPAAQREFARSEMRAAVSLHQGIEVDKGFTAEKAKAIRDGIVRTALFLTGQNPRLEDIENLDSETVRVPDLEKYIDGMLVLDDRQTQQEIQQLKRSDEIYFGASLGIIAAVFGVLSFSAFMQGFLAVALSLGIPVFGFGAVILWIFMTLPKIEYDDAKGRYMNEDKVIAISTTVDKDQIAYVASHETTHDILKRNKSPFWLDLPTTVGLYLTDRYSSDAENYPEFKDGDQLARDYLTGAITEADFQKKFLQFFKRDDAKVEENYGLGYFLLEALLEAKEIARQVLGERDGTALVDAVLLAAAQGPATVQQIQQAVLEAFHILKTNLDQSGKSVSSAREPQAGIKKLSAGLGTENTGPENALTRYREGKEGGGLIVSVSGGAKSVMIRARAAWDIFTIPEGYDAFYWFENLMKKGADRWMPVMDSIFSGNNAHHRAFATVILMSRLASVHNEAAQIYFHAILPEITLKDVADAILEGYGHAHNVPLTLIYEGSSHAQEILKGLLTHENERVRTLTQSLLREASEKHIPGAQQLLDEVFYLEGPQTASEVLGAFSNTVHELGAYAQIVPMTLAELRQLGQLDYHVLAVPFPAGSVHLSRGTQNEIYSGVTGYDISGMKLTNHPGGDPFPTGYQTKSSAGVEDYWGDLRRAGASDQHFIVTPQGLTRYFIDPEGTAGRNEIEITWDGEAPQRLHVEEGESFDATSDLFYEDAAKTRAKNFQVTGLTTPNGEAVRVEFYSWQSLEALQTGSGAQRLQALIPPALFNAGLNEAESPLLAGPAAAQTNQSVAPATEQTSTALSVSPSSRGLVASDAPNLHPGTQELLSFVGGAGVFTKDEVLRLATPNVIDADQSVDKKQSLDRVRENLDLENTEPGFREATVRGVAAAVEAGAVDSALLEDILETALRDPDIRVQIAALNLFSKTPKDGLTPDRAAALLMGIFSTGSDELIYRAVLITGSLETLLSEQKERFFRLYLENYSKVIRFALRRDNFGKPSAVFFQSLVEAHLEKPVNEDILLRALDLLPALNTNLDLIDGLSDVLNRIDLTEQARKNIFGRLPHPGRAAHTAQLALPAPQTQETQLISSTDIERSFEVRLKEIFKSTDGDKSYREVRQFLNDLGQSSLEAASREALLQQLLKEVSRLKKNRSSSLGEIAYRVDDLGLSARGMYEAYSRLADLDFDFFWTSAIVLETKQRQSSVEYAAGSAMEPAQKFKLFERLFSSKKVESLRRHDDVDRLKAALQALVSARLSVQDDLFLMARLSFFKTAEMERVIQVAQSRGIQIDPQFSQGAAIRIARPEYTQELKRYVESKNVQLIRGEIPEDSFSGHKALEGTPVVHEIKALPLRRSEVRSPLGKSLEPAVEEVVVNAIKAAVEGGTKKEGQPSVSVEVEVVQEHPALGGQPAVVISIADNGRGLNPVQLKEVAQHYKKAYGDFQDSDIRNNLGEAWVSAVEEIAGTTEPTANDSISNDALTRFLLYRPAEAFFSSKYPEGSDYVGRFGTAKDPEGYFDAYYYAVVEPVHDFPSGRSGAYLELLMAAYPGTKIVMRNEPRQGFTTEIVLPANGPEITNINQHVDEINSLVAAAIEASKAKDSIKQLSLETPLHINFKPAGARSEVRVDFNAVATSIAGYEAFEVPFSQAAERAVLLGLIRDTVLRVSKEEISNSKFQEAVGDGLSVVLWGGTARQILNQLIRNSGPLYTKDVDVFFFGRQDGIRRPIRVPSQIEKGFRAAIGIEAIDWGMGFAIDLTDDGEELDFNNPVFVDRLIKQLQTEENGDLKINKTSITIDFSKVAPQSIRIEAPAGVIQKLRQGKLSLLPYNPDTRENTLEESGRLITRMGTRAAQLNFVSGLALDTDSDKVLDQIIKKYSEFLEQANPSNPMAVKKYKIEIAHDLLLGILERIRLDLNEPLEDTINELDHNDIFYAITRKLGLSTQELADLKADVKVKRSEIERYIDRALLSKKLRVAKDLSNGESGVRTKRSEVRIQSPAISELVKENSLARSEVRVTNAALEKPAKVSLKRWALTQRSQEVIGVDIIEKIFLEDKGATIDDPEKLSFHKEFWQNLTGKKPQQAYVAGRLVEAIARFTRQRRQREGSSEFYYEAYGAFQEQQLLPAYDPKNEEQVYQQLKRHGFFSSSTEAFLEFIGEVTGIEVDKGNLPVEEYFKSAEKLAQDILRQMAQGKLHGVYAIRFTNNEFTEAEDVVAVDVPWWQSRLLAMIKIANLGLVAMYSSTILKYIFVLVALLLNWMLGGAVIVGAAFVLNIYLYGWIRGAVSKVVDGLRLNYFVHKQKELQYEKLRIFISEEDKPRRVKIDPEDYELIGPKESFTDEDRDKGKTLTPRQNRKYVRKLIGKLVGQIEDLDTEYTRTESEASRREAAIVLRMLTPLLMDAFGDAPWFPPVGRFSRFKTEQVASFMKNLIKQQKNKLSRQELAWALMGYLMTEIGVSKIPAKNFVRNWVPPLKLFSSHAIQIHRLIRNFYEGLAKALPHDDFLDKVAERLVDEAKVGISQENKAKVKLARVHSSEITARRKTLELRNVIDADRRLFEEYLKSILNKLPAIARQSKSPVLKSLTTQQIKLKAAIEEASKNPSVSPLSKRERFELLRLKLLLRFTEWRLGRVTASYEKKQANLDSERAMVGGNILGALFLNQGRLLDILKKARNRDDKATPQFVFWAVHRAIQWKKILADLKKQDDAVLAQLNLDRNQLDSLIRMINLSVYRLIRARAHWAFTPLDSAGKPIKRSELSDDQKRDARQYSIAASKFAQAVRGRLMNDTDWSFNHTPEELSQMGLALVDYKNQHQWITGYAALTESAAKEKFIDDIIQNLRLKDNTEGVADSPASAGKPATAVGRSEVRTETESEFEVPFSALSRIIAGQLSAQVDPVKGLGPRGRLRGGNVDTKQGAVVSGQAADPVLRGLVAQRPTFDAAKNRAQQRVFEIFDHRIEGETASQLLTWIEAHPEFGIFAVSTEQLAAESLVLNVPVFQASADGSMVPVLDEDGRTVTKIAPVSLADNVEVLRSGRAQQVLDETPFSEINAEAAELRVSMGGLVDVVVVTPEGEEKHLLVINQKGLRNNKLKLAPFGGGIGGLTLDAVNFLTQGFEQGGIGLAADDFETVVAKIQKIQSNRPGIRINARKILGDVLADGTLDLRLLIKGAASQERFSRLIDWFKSRAGRETLPLRELQEEVKEQELPPDVGDAITRKKVPKPAGRLLSGGVLLSVKSEIGTAQQADRSSVLTQRPTNVRPIAVTTLDIVRQLNFLGLTEGSFLEHGAGRSLDADEIHFNIFQGKFFPGDFAPTLVGLPVGLVTVKLQVDGRLVVHFAKAQELDPQGKVLEQLRKLAPLATGLEDVIETTGKRVDAPTAVLPAGREGLFRGVPVTVTTATTRSEVRQEEGLAVFNDLPIEYKAFFPEEAELRFSLQPSKFNPVLSEERGAVLRQLASNARITRDLKKYDATLQDPFLILANEMGPLNFKHLFTESPRIMKMILQQRLGLKGLLPNITGSPESAPQQKAEVLMSHFEDFFANLKNERVPSEQWITSSTLSLAQKEIRDFLAEEDVVRGKDLLNDPQAALLLGERFAKVLLAIVILKFQGKSKKRELEQLRVLAFFIANTVRVQSVERNRGLLEEDDNPNMTSDLKFDLEFMAEPRHGETPLLLGVLAHELGHTIQAFQGIDPLFELIPDLEAFTVLEEHHPQGIDDFQEIIDFTNHFQRAEQGVDEVHVNARAAIVRFLELVKQENQRRATANEAQLTFTWREALEFSNAMFRPVRTREGIKEILPLAEWPQAMLQHLLVKRSEIPSMDENKLGGRKGHGPLRGVPAEPSTTAASKPATAGKPTTAGRRSEVRQTSEQVNADTVGEEEDDGERFARLALEKNFPPNKNIEVKRITREGKEISAITIRIAGTEEDVLLTKVAIGGTAQVFMGGGYVLKVASSQNNNESLKAEAANADAIQAESEKALEADRPAVVPVLSHGTIKVGDDSLYSLLMRESEGAQDLRTLSSSGDIRGLLDALAQYVKIVMQLDELGFALGDLKGANALVDKNGSVLAIDLGSVRRTTDTGVSDKNFKTGYSPGYFPSDKIKDFLEKYKGGDITARQLLTAISISELHKVLLRDVFNDETHTGGKNNFVYTGGNVRAKVEEAFGANAEKAMVIITEVSNLANADPKGNEGAFDLLWGKLQELIELAPVATGAVQGENLQGLDQIPIATVTEGDSQPTAAAEPVQIQGRVKAALNSFLVNHDFSTLNRLEVGVSAEIREFLNKGKGKDDKVMHRVSVALIGSEVQSVRNFYGSAAFDPLVGIDDQGIKKYNNFLFALKAYLNSESFKKLSDEAAVAALLPGLKAETEKHSIDQIIAEMTEVIDTQQSASVRSAKTVYGGAPVSAVKSVIEEAGLQPSQLARIKDTLKEKLLESVGQEVNQGEVVARSEVRSSLLITENLDAALQDALAGPANQLGEYALKGRLSQALLNDIATALEKAQKMDGVTVDAIVEIVRTQVQRYVDDANKNKGEEKTSTSAIKDETVTMLTDVLMFAMKKSLQGSDQGGKTIVLSTTSADSASRLASAVKVIKQLAATGALEHVVLNAIDREARNRAMGAFSRDGVGVRITQSNGHLEHSARSLSGQKILPVVHNTDVLDVTNAAIFGLGLATDLERGKILSPSDLAMLEIAQTVVQITTAVILAEELANPAQLLIPGNQSETLKATLLRKLLDVSSFTMLDEESQGVLTFVNGQLSISQQGVFNLLQKIQSDIEKVRAVAEAA